MKELKEFKRIELFNYYNNCDNPFIIVTIPLNVTEIVKYCKIHKNFYATMGYIITKTVNEIEEFKYRYIDGKFYYYDTIDSNYTQRKEDAIGFYDVLYNEDYNSYITDYKNIESKFYNNEDCLLNKTDVIWLSCAPWFKFNGLVTPFNKNNTIPQFIWDKYELKDDKYYVNLMIMIHHGFVDGYHVAKFINKLEENINNFNKELV